MIGMHLVSLHRFQRVKFGDEHHIIGADRFHRIDPHLERLNQINLGRQCVQLCLERLRLFLGTRDKDALTKDGVQRVFTELDDMDFDFIHL